MEKKPYSDSDDGGKHQRHLTAPVTHAPDIMAMQNVIHIRMGYRERL